MNRSVQLQWFCPTRSGREKPPRVVAKYSRRSAASKGCAGVASKGHGSLPGAVVQHARANFESFYCPLLEHDRDGMMRVTITATHVNNAVCGDN